MIGNNLSALGVSFAQLDGKPATTANALIWMPTTGEFGAGYGDFENHQKLATRVATHFSFSDENRQSQPNTESIENTQIRLTDGTLVFNNNLFGPGKNVNEVNYTMWDMDGGIKKRGISLEGEYYQRWLTNFRSTTGSLNIPTYFARASRCNPPRWSFPRPCKRMSADRRSLDPTAIPGIQGSVRTGIRPRIGPFGGITNSCISQNLLSATPQYPLLSGAKAGSTTRRLC